MKRLWAILLCMCLLSGCTGPFYHTEETVFAMNTVFTIDIYGADSRQASGEIWDMVSRLEKSWSVTDPNSLITRLNAGNAPALTEEEQELLTGVEALQLRTGGLYDPHLYALCSAWGLYHQQFRVPSQEEIADSLQHDQWDLGGALKGYCAVQAVDVLRSMDVSHATLSFGGNIQTYGNKPDGTAWLIGIQDPDGGAPAALVSVTGTMAIVTSGDYQRSFQLDGRTYHHILDPRTGYPADTGLRSVTIICEDGLVADCLSTALFVMGLEEASRFWRQSDDFEAVFITTDGTIYATEGAAVSGCEYEVIRR